MDSPAPTGAPARAPLWRLLAAFAATYLFWGATFLAIRVLVQEHPPFTLAGFRFLLAGGLLYGGARLAGAARPSGPQWRHAMAAGTFLFFLTYAAVFWSSQYLPSGLVATLSATIPLWVVLFDLVRPGAARPPVWTWAGLAAGFAGVALIVRPEPHLLRDVPIVPVAVALGGALCWSIGTTVLLRRKGTGATVLATGQQMLWGGLLLTVVGVGTGERPDPRAWAHVVPWAAFGYLVVCGSILAFIAYQWLLRTVTPARASSYAYANPVVAIVLGWLILSEPVTWAFAFGGGLVVAGVAIVHLARHRRPRATTAAEGPSAGGATGAAGR